MVEIPDQLRSLFTAAIERRNGSHVIEVPKREVERGAITLSEQYRVVVLGHESAEQVGGPDDERRTSTESQSPDGKRAPPVEEGEQREVTIEAMGNHGDGIAKVDRGYVVIVPGTTRGDEVTIRIERVRESVAFAEVLQYGSQQSEQGVQEQEQTLDHGEGKASSPAEADGELTTQSSSSEADQHS